MPDGAQSILLKVASGLGDVSAEQWDACAGSGNPFVSHAFLSLLEDSGCVCAETGWLPQHLLMEDQKGRLIGAVPLYLKGHSYGEYVFDWGWAEAYQRAGGNYYPKMQCAVPFTPVPGPRLLVRPEAQRALVIDSLIAGMTEITRQHEASSLHVTFPTRREWEAFGEAGLLQRIGVQFHWFNRGYSSFEAFLAALTSRKRKAIRKERRQVADAGIVLRRLVGSDIKARHWDAFWRFYLNTIDRKWSQAYLTRDFFLALGERLGDRVLLILAEHDGRPVAGALNLLGDEALYGRNWGAAGDFRFLHFEACYYQAMEFAIEHGLARVEAGAQGHHKLQRGYEPVETLSAHYIRDPGFRDAVAEFLQRETAAVRRQIGAFRQDAPYRMEAES